MVVYDTSHRNTKTIAETIVKTLKECETEVDFFHVKDAKKLIAKDYDFLFLGSPTRMHTMSWAVRGFAGRLKSQES